MDRTDHTDLGNAHRLVRRHGRDLRYCHPWNRWLVYDGTRWDADNTGTVMHMATETVRAIYAEAADEPDADRRAAVASHARASERLERIKAMVTLARSEPSVPVLPDAFDCDPWILNVANGTLDLRTGTLRPHDRDDLLTKMAPVTFDPAATCPTWDSFVARIMDDRHDLIAFLQRAAGYSLTGDTGERVLFVLYGGGSNGKSTLLETWRAMLGDYAINAPSSTLMAKRGDSIPNDVARLKGARFVTCSETSEGRRLDVELVKRMTGNDIISARFMRAEWFDFRPAFKLWLATNHKPTVDDTTESIWSRIRLIPFDVAIPAEERDPALLQKLRAELPGILRWAVEGCQRWQRDRLATPAAVATATAAYRQENDIIARFLDDKCTVSGSAWARSSDLYVAYGRWCTANREEELTLTAFGTKLAEKGFTKKRNSLGQTLYSGVGLRTEGSE